MPTTSRWLPNTTTTNTSGTGFLSLTDVTDSVILDFVAANDSRLSTWMDYVDGEILALAQEKEVQLQSISMPLHKKILEFAKAYFCWLVFTDTLQRLQNYEQANVDMLKMKLNLYDG